MGDAMVKPSRLRKEARRTAGTERSSLNSFVNNDDDDDDDVVLLSGDCRK